MRIAVIGGGVSGLGAAYLLSSTHDVTLFERDARLGGHANTVDVRHGGQTISVDTGFIVYNELNYPHFSRLLAHLGVASHASDMSFALTDGRTLEWSSNGLGGLFAWKRNAFDPGYVGMLADILRFSTAARADLASGAVTGSLGDYVARLGLSRRFRNDYLLPMGAAIWSTAAEDMLAYPAKAFLAFFDNHRLLHVDRPQWRTVEGGSRTYVAALAERLGPAAKVAADVRAVWRSEGQAIVRLVTGEELKFDQVVLACHSDQALKLLLDASHEEHAALAAVRYAPNTAVLHHDERLMPRRRKAWASWNYLRDQAEDGGPACVTYWMNRLQGIDEEAPLFVTLNPRKAPAPEKVYASFSYDHPQFDGAALAAQDRIRALQGADRIWFAGAWLGSGFHEDGLRSAADVAVRLGAALPWDITRAIADTPRARPPVAMRAA